MYSKFYFMRALLCVALLIGAGELSAQSKVQLSSEQAVQLALENQPLLLAAQAVVAQAEGRLLQAGRLSNPELGLSYQGDQAFNDEGEQNFGLAFTQRFPVTNRLKLERALAQKEIEVARAEIEEQMRELKLQVRLAVVTLATTQAEWALRSQLTELNRNFLKFIESRVQTGEASTVEVDQLQMALYVTEQEAHHLEHQLIVDRAALNELMGMPADYEFELSTPLAMPTQAPSFPEFSQTRLEQHPSYRLRQLLLELAEGRIASARAERWADVAVQIFYKEERSMDAPEGLGRGRSFGLGISVPLPLHDRNQGNIAASRAARNEMQWRLQSIASKLQIEAKLQSELASELYHQAEKYETQLRAVLDRNAAAMQTAYTNGQISLPELFQSQEQQLKIQSTQIEVLSELKKSKIRWSAATDVELAGL
ncbi:TolC family protein [Coraliomargarita sp. SDUM461003]|uniref:TolC family protein n=1 Tax=Thalassobacterium maritimum TaxID=3041265 RepID=A0ABU1AP35_9BACT|nr:TolC family protein [Coraliomargarita sp. SDUM461003]MDQ8205928.1 TolC family protein [Coraliomargarita sp. SDUM461003]